MRLHEFTGSKFPRLFHFSTDDNLVKIKQHGFVPSGDDAAYGAGVYFTDDDNFKTLPYVEATMVPNKSLVIPKGLSPNKIYMDMFGVYSHDSLWKSKMNAAGYGSVIVNRPDGSVWTIVLDPKMVTLVEDL